MISCVNYVIYGCFSARTTPGVSLYPSLTLKEILWQLLPRQGDRLQYEKAN